ncbi:MAG TPA: hypothetical protein VHO26_04805 [Propionibacteriaceae bacterium]|nr:hypothetical protein [Propionibacteriaceae bacterium]
MDRSRAARRAWLSLLGIPVAYIGAFLIGEPLAAWAGLEEGTRAPWWLALVMIAMMLLLFGVAVGVSLRLCSRARSLGVRNAMVPAWIVSAAAVVTLLQGAIGYLFSWA